MSHLKSLTTKQTTTCDVVNPGLGQAKQCDGVKPGLGQGKQCDGVKLINVIPNLLL